MADMDQYPALVDLEQVIKELAKTTGRPVAVVYDPKGGWCVSDEVRKAPSKHGTECPEYGVQTYQDWFSRTIGEAALVAFGIRFLPGSLVGRLFKKPPPAQHEEVAGARVNGAQTPQARQEESRPPVGVGPGSHHRQAIGHQPRQQFGVPTKQPQGNQSATRSGLQAPKAQRPTGAPVQNLSSQSGEGDRRAAAQGGQPSRQVTRDGRLQPAMAGDSQGGIRGPVKRR